MRARILALTILIAIPSIAADRSMPVMVGEEPNLDACMSLGAVSGLRHSRLAVRSGPGTRYGKRDELQNGQSVYICSSSADGKWVGIVYVSGKSTPNTPECGVTSPAPAFQPYQGPCKSGWVNWSWLVVVAG